MIDVVGMAPKTVRNWVIDTLMEFLNSPEGSETANWIMQRHEDSRYWAPRVADMIDSGASLEEVAKARISSIYTDRGRQGFNIKIESHGCWAAMAVDHFNSLDDTPFNSVVAKESNNVFRVHIK